MSAIFSAPVRIDVSTDTAELRDMRITGVGKRWDLIVLAKIGGKIVEDIIRS